MVTVHNDSPNLRQFAEYVLCTPEQEFYREHIAHFEIEEHTGLVGLTIYDSGKQELQVKLTPDELSQGLKRLEETKSNDPTLVSFFSELAI